MNRLVIIPDKAHETLGATLKPRLSAIVHEINASNLAQVMGDHSMRYFISEGAREISELLLWVGDGNGYAVGLSSRAPKGEVEGRGRAAASEGMIACVMASGRSESEKAFDLQASDWTNLESLRGLGIREMASTPVFLFESCTFVLSRVLYIGADMDDSALLPPAEMASTLGRLIEDRLIRATLGIEAI